MKNINNDDEWEIPVKIIKPCFRNSYVSSIFTEIKRQNLVSNANPKQEFEDNRRVIDKLCDELIQLFDNSQIERDQKLISTLISLGSAIAISNNQHNFLRADLAFKAEAKRTIQSLHSKKDSEDRRKFFRVKARELEAERNTKKQLSNKGFLVGELLNVEYQGKRYKEDQLNKWLVHYKDQSKD
jgi:hypothetical protein